MKIQIAFVLTLLACDGPGRNRPAMYCVHTQGYELCERTRGDCLLRVNRLRDYTAPFGEACQPMKQGWRLGVGTRESCANCEDHPHVEMYSSRPACEAAQLILAMKGYRTDDCEEW